MDDSSNWGLWSVWFSKGGNIAIWNGLCLITGVTDLEVGVVVGSEGSICLYSHHKVENFSYTKYTTRQDS